MKVLLSLLLLLGLAFAKIHPEAKLPFMEYCKHFGYPVEQHNVTTEDGYILSVFRIQRKASVIRSGLKPMLLQHGLLDSSDTWLINEEGLAPGFVFANRGYDVWFGNSRGNKHSRRHTHLNPDKDPQFWAFSFQEMADYDLPAVFTYIFNLTGQKVHYFGHSQGTMQMHIALAKRNPVVESLMDKYFAFGPIALITNQ